ncbi:hypothetical protein LCGC14_1197000 [marine sediment metagenome]|uniref:Uncharacterized protein n=1 Tax=marine sediment metagenome TaxID=412755 RepID=A0A0F9LMI0_9ZZZZ
MPKAISVKSGSKLGKFYKARGSIFDMEVVLKQFYAGLKGKPTIKKLDDNTYDVSVKYSKKFCPIGGIHNPSRGSVFQENICIPYMRRFLSEIFPHLTTESDFLNCIPLNNQRTCNYILKVKEIKK